jgi:hypothetical protein
MADAHTGNISEKVFQGAFPFDRDRLVLSDIS